MFLPGISAQHQAQASTATNINKLIRAVKKKADSSGAVSYKDGTTEMKVILKSASKLQFYLKAQSGNTVLLIQMVFSKSSKYVTPIVLFAFDRDKDGKYDSKICYAKRIKISKIVKGKKIGFIYYKNGSTFSDASGKTQTISESVFSSAMAGWNKLIYELSGLHFSDIGFTKYN